MKTSLHSITNQKLANLQNTIGRLILIIFTLSYGAYHLNVILEHNQFTKYCHTPLNLRFHVFFCAFQHNDI